MPRIVSFTAKDREGVSHLYSCTLHPATEGQLVMWQLVAMGTVPMAGALKGLLPLLDEVKGRKLTSLLDDPELFATIRAGLMGIDFAAIGEDVKRSLLTTAMGPLVAEVLSRTMRDDRPLSNRTAFDEAYSGNYAELMMALWEVVLANRFLPLPGM